MKNRQLPMSRDVMEELVRDMTALAVKYQRLVPEGLRYGMIVNIVTQKGMDEYFREIGRKETWKYPVIVDGKVDIGGDTFCLPSVRIDEDGGVISRYDWEVTINGNRWS